MTTLSHMIVSMPSVCAKYVSVQCHSSNIPRAAGSAIWCMHQASRDVRALPRDTEGVLGSRTKRSLCVGNHSLAGYPEDAEKLLHRVAKVGDELLKFSHDDLSRVYVKNFVVSPKRTAKCWWNIYGRIEDQSTKSAIEQS